MSRIKGGCDGTLPEGPGCCIMACKKRQVRGHRDVFSIKGASPRVEGRPQAALVGEKMGGKKELAVSGKHLIKNSPSGIHIAKGAATLGIKLKNTRERESLHPPVNPARREVLKAM